MSLRIYNSLTRQKEEFVPLTPGEVRMYVCGVTPYDLSHIGHGRSVLAFDVIRRYLTFRGYRVTFVQNFTDIEDKIIARAAQIGEPWRDLVDRYIDAYNKDMEWLGIAPPTEAPRATKHIEPEPGRPYRMITLIQRLLAKGVAYVVDGDVYFEVRRFPAYGRLSGRNLDDLRAGARVDVDERKRDPLDFALWKAAKPGEPEWPSPWGPGRPGWHIECSAMSMQYLGETFDIHGGGQDLIFPHHENEIAQSEAATGKAFVRYWIHNGFVNVDAEKMSKSLGNMLNITDLRKYHREAVRLYLLETHYRGPLEFRESQIIEPYLIRGRVRNLIMRAFDLAGDAGIPGEEMQRTEWEQIDESFIERLLAQAGGDELYDDVLGCYAEFKEAMDEDFNTPQASSALYKLRDVIDRYRELGVQGERLTRFRHGTGVLMALGRVLGLFWWQPNPHEITPENRAEIDPLVAERDEARRRRDWKRADEIRAQLEALGVAVEDTPSGKKWKWKRAPNSP